MRFPNLLLVAIMLMAISCEKKVDQEAIDALAGHWHIWNYEPSSDSPDEESLLAKEAILELVKIGCDPMEFTFNSDAGVRYTDGMKYLNASMGDDGVEVGCANNYDDKYGSFDFNYSKLTLNYESETVVLDAALEDEYLTTIVDNMLINGVTVSGKLFFIREVDIH